MRQKPVRYRRHSTLVLYWKQQELVFENYTLGTKIAADPLVFAILQNCGEWRSIGEIAWFLSEYKESSVLRSLKQLCKHGLLERSRAGRNPRTEAMEGWAPWNPAAGLFHFSTKDVEYSPDQYALFQQLRRRTRHDPVPLPVKSYPKLQRTRLPRVPREGEFASVLKERRTWRKFGTDAVALEALAQTLELTFGVRGWVDVPGYGRLAVKTSASGGDLHPIEAYVLVQRVKGLRRGMYHYNAARHELERLRGGIARKQLERNLGHQWWFTDAAFLVLMTAVFDRTQWKYASPRAYRVILAEAGHLCQTFCLTATWLGLAPFCTMAFQDSQWEKWLGIDGVGESMLYIAGAGTRPKDEREAHLGKIGNARVLRATKY